MNAEVERTVNRSNRCFRTGLSGLKHLAASALLSACGVLSLALVSGGPLFGQAHPAPAPPVQAPAPQNHPLPVPEVRQGVAPQPARPGQQHLPDWWNAHRSLTPAQQEDALRREPGFRSLPSEQQQRLIDRLHQFDQKTPEQQRRIMARNEAFERLSPERKQEVRGATQALSQMPAYRQQVVRRAFQQLRRMPPQQRQQLLNSPVYGGQFTGQERTVLGNLLSIEPYEATRSIPQPYFGRP